MCVAFCSVSVLEPVCRSRPTDGGEVVVVHARPPAAMMMPSRSTPNLQTPKKHPLSVYYRDAESPPPAPPVRDSSSLKSIKYGPGHEKFPSWPVPAAAEAPQALRGPPSGGSHRSKSWTEHTDYPKEKPATYTRPYMKRQHPSMQQKLKTVMEKCEKINPETYESRIGHFLPKDLRDCHPERDLSKHLTKADLEEYVRSYEDPAVGHLTQAELEEYTRSYEEGHHHHHHHNHQHNHHQKQASYAQSEGYHSYVSSSDSTSTPFLDRLRRDSEAVAGNRTWGEEGRDSVVTTSSGSASSSETLKWHGSMSDVSVASSSCASVSRQLIVHSARVKTPQKHNSESVLYIGTDWKDQEKRNNTANKLKLFPVNTYTVEPSELQVEQNERLSSLSVADRIHELEKQQKYSYLDPEKRHRIPDPTLKAIQKKALLSFYERHHPRSSSGTWRSEPQLARSQPTLTPAPQPPPRVKLQSASRRASCASDYASGSNSRRSSFSTREHPLTPRHQHSNSCGSLSTDLLGPVIVGPSISIDDWVPERPPKNPHLRAAYPDLFRLPSPDLPPPSPPTVLEDEVFNSDEPLPPPPPELRPLEWSTRQFAEPQVETTAKLKEGRFSTKGDVLRPLDFRGGQRASIAESPSREVPPPPLQPRQMRINQSMRVRMPEKKAVELSRASPPRLLKQRDGQRPLNYTMSHSKASYLASRRERERIVPDSDTGVYKRTMSPNGHSLAAVPSMEPLKTSQRSLGGTHLLRRVSMTEKPNKNPSILSLRCESKEDYKKPLPDVLPVKEKILPLRPMYPVKPDNEILRKPPKYESPPSSPSKSPSRNSPFTPLRSTLLSSPPTEKERSSTSSSSSLSSLTSSPEASPMISISTNTPPSTTASSPKTYFATFSSPPSSPKDKEPPAVQTMQRTEVILRVNVSTIDAASQTEKELPPTPIHSRRKLKEEIECEKLSQDIVNQLLPTDRLKDILLPGPQHKKPSDYVSGLFRVDVTSRPRPLISPFKSSSPPSSICSSTTSLIKFSCSDASSGAPSLEAASLSSPTSTYFNTSESKAKFLARFNQDMNQYNIVKDTKDLNQKKSELVNRLDRKLEVLRGEQLVVSEECRINDELGENVEVHMNRLARPHEAAKFRLHVEEVGKITSLLLGLSGRLARAENALLGANEEHPERCVMEGKRDKLKEQLEEAKKLKESIDRRSISVSNILCKYMSSEEYADYDHFINMKAKLIMDAREIADKIKLGEEQLLALKETLTTAD